MKYRKAIMTGALALVFVSGLCLNVWFAQAQNSPPPPGFRSLPKPSADKVTGPELSALIRGTLIALQQANSTGNYTVLRDLGAINFRTLNTPVRLGNVYSKIRESEIDLTPVIFLDPLMTKPPIIDRNGILIVEGFFPTEPLNIVFKMGFRFEYGAWRLLSLTVGAQDSPLIQENTKKTGSDVNEPPGKANLQGKPPVPKVKPSSGQ